VYIFKEVLLSLSRKLLNNVKPQSNTDTKTVLICLIYD